MLTRIGSHSTSRATMDHGLAFLSLFTAALWLIILGRLSSSISVKATLPNLFGYCHRLPCARFTSLISQGARPISLRACFSIRRTDLAMNLVALHSTQWHLGAGGIIRASMLEYMRRSPTLEAQISLWNSDSTASRLDSQEPEALLLLIPSLPNSTTFTFRGPVC
jgi:hypothetical protein